MKLFNVTSEDEVVIVVGDGNNVRMLANEAHEIASTQSLDLVQVNTNGEGIPVLKICDYSKIKYDHQKRAKELQKKQRKNQQVVKEIKITYGTSEHDLETKAKAIDRFLSDGAKVIISIQFKGRTSKFVTSGIDKIKSLVVLVKNSYTICQEPKIEGNKVVMIISSKNK